MQNRVRQTFLSLSAYPGRQECLLNNLLSNAAGITSVLNNNEVSNYDKTTGTGGDAWTARQTGSAQGLPSSGVRQWPSSVQGSSASRPSIRVASHSFRPARCSAHASGTARNSA